MSSSQPDHRRSSPSPTSSFSFPTLNLDGSLPDLNSTTPPPRSYPPAPPAALSSLGARAKMAEMAADSFSDGSIDAHYDMMDDISDISNDDHETASLSSTRDEDDTDEGEMTPDDSIVDVRDEQEAAERSSEGRAENNLVQSYLSEDLETPRQSTIATDLLGRIANINPSLDSDGTQKQLHRARRVLFVSERDITNDTISDICIRLASLLSPDHHAVEDSIAQSVRLPTIFSNTAASSVLHVRHGQVELLVDRCIGAKECGDEDSSAYALVLKKSPHQVQTAILCPDGGSMVQPLDLIVYYTQTSQPPAWFTHVRSALAASSSLCMCITAPGVDLDEAHETKGDLVVTHDGLFDHDDKTLRAAIDLTRTLNAQNTQTKPAGSFTELLYNKLGIRSSLRTDLRWTILIIASWLGVLAAATFIPRYLRMLDGVDPAKQVDVRRHTLNTMWTKTTNSSDAEAAYNISHLLPYPEVPWPQSGLVPHDVRYQTSAPNHIIIALPQDAASRRFPTITSTHVQKRGVRLDFNQTQLAQGVYDITIHESDANGVILVTMDTKNPAINVIAEPNFGMSALYRKTYEKASMEISKAINKDVMVARKNAKSIRNKLGLELSAGAAATKNVTSELAIYIARDLQVLANTAVSVFAKAASAGNESASNLKKELMVIRKDLIQLSDDMQKSLVSTAGAVKALMPTAYKLKKRLSIARVRAHRIRDRVVGKKGFKRAVKNKSITKDLSLRWRDLFKQDLMISKASSFADMARCSRSNNYKACMKDKKANKALSSTTSKALQAVLTPFTSTSSQHKSTDKPIVGKPSLDPRKKAENKKSTGPKKGKKGKRADDVKKNAKKNEARPKSGKKWPLR